MKKLADYEQEMKKNHVIEQLAKFGYTDIEGLTYKELKTKLAVARAMEVDPIKRKEWF